MIIMWLPFRYSPSRWSEEGTTSLCSSQHHITGVVEQTSRRLRGPLATSDRALLKGSGDLGSKMSRVLS